MGVRSAASCPRSPGRTSSRCSPRTAARRRCARPWTARTPLRRAALRGRAATSSSTPPSAPASPTWRARSRPARASSATRTSRCRILADRAAEVAADFFYAAVDEFDDRAHALARHAPHARPGHAQGHGRVLRLHARRSSTTSSASTPPPRTPSARVWEGYGVGAALDEARLFRAMGFHTGSEVLADAGVRRARSRAAGVARRARGGARDHEGPAPRRAPQRLLLDPHPHQRGGRPLRRRAQGRQQRAALLRGAAIPRPRSRAGSWRGSATFADVQGAFMARLGEP